MGGHPQRRLELTHRENTTPHTDVNTPQCNKSFSYTRTTECSSSTDDSLCTVTLCYATQSGEHQWRPREISDCRSSRPSPECIHTSTRCLKSLVMLLSTTGNTTGCGWRRTHTHRFLCLLHHMQLCEFYAVSGNSFSSFWNFYAKS